MPFAPDDECAINWSVRNRLNRRCWFSNRFYWRNGGARSQCFQRMHSTSSISIFRGNHRGQNLVAAKHKIDKSNFEFSKWYRWFEHSPLPCTNFIKHFNRIKFTSLANTFSHSSMTSDRLLDELRIRSSLMNALSA